MKRLIFLILIIPFTLNYAFAQKDKKLVRQGNSLYEKNKFSEAEISYRKALEKDPKSYTAQFNLNDALYKQKKYDEVAKNFGDMTGLKSSKENLAKVYHNIGNSYLQARKYQESINAYKNALRNNPNDEDTRYNLLYAQQQLLKQQQQNKQKQDKNNKDNKNKDKKDQNKQKQDKKDQQDKQNPQQQKEKISKEDAQRMLQSLENDEKNTMKKLKEENAKANKKTVEKNW